MKFQKRNVFNLSHTKKFDLDAGQLIPIVCEEVIPGDTFRVKTDMLVRLAPMVGPMYQEVNVKTRYFFVPNRIIWDQWEQFITGGPDGLDNSIFPTCTTAGINKYQLQDYFGLPITGNHITFSALPFRAYHKIWNDWFTDQWLIGNDVFGLGGGDDEVTNCSTVHNVCWEKDYFTSSLPQTQRGAPVTVPIAGTAPVTMTGELPLETMPGNQAVTVGLDGTIYSTNPQVGGTVRGNTAYTDSIGASTLAGTADLSGANPITINDLRMAFQMQKVLERNARAGGRYTEFLHSMFGVRSSDARLQRAEFLGGGESQVIVSEVIQTSETNTTPQGHMAGHGFSAHRSHEFKKSFEEHGYIIGLLYILPRTSYQQGMARHWNRRSKWDFFLPLLAHLGEQGVLNKELYFSGIDGQDDNVFGYQGRWDELRRRESSVAGDFRNTSGYGAWCMTRIFDSRPNLGEDFLVATPSKVPFADMTDPPYIVLLKNNIKAIRPLPKTAVPGMVDH